MCRDQRPCPGLPGRDDHFSVALTIMAIVIVLLLVAAYIYDRRDGRTARRAALHAALDRGEIRPEDYARAIGPAA